MKRYCLLVTAIFAFVLSYANVASAGNTRTFWTEASTADITTSVNVLNFDDTTTVTVTATFYDVNGNALGNTTKALAPNARWNFITNNIGNSTLGFYLWSAGSGTVRVSSSDSTQNFGAYGTVYKTTTISGFNFTLPSGSADAGAGSGTSYTLTTSSTSYANLSSKGVAISSISHADYLTGSHSTLVCYNCHVLNFVQGPAHSSSNTACDDCHTTTTFTGTEYTHTTMTFNGAHATIQSNCTSCHSATSSTLNWTGVTTESECSTCHAANFTPNAGHGSNTNCTDCHTNTAWTGATVSHTSMTFSGAHSAIETTCTKCHASDSPTLLWTGVTTESECSTCHAANFIASPAHGSNTTCSDCHTTTTFVGATYTHATMTFTGSHAAIETTCTKCHESGSSTLLWPGVTLENQCNTCHAAKPGPLGFNIIEVPEVRQAAKQNPHDGGMVGPDKPDPSTETGFYASSNAICAYCHSFLGSANFDHVPHKTGLRCNQCHYSNAAWTAGTKLTSSDYHDTLTGTCETCHTSSAPASHSTTDCATCHRYSAATWSVSYPSHTTMTFSGNHANIETSCTSCHVSGKSELLFTGATLETQCGTCHTGDMPATSAHSSNNTTCSDCHTTSGWPGATINHATMTFSGAHASIEATCTKCHASDSSTLLFSGATLETQCGTCHASTMPATTAHSANNTTCSDCHTTTTFAGATITHATMTFGGAHASIESTCTKCHESTSSALLFSGATLETQCGTCHASTMPATTAHSASNTTCSDCHTTTTFTGATYTHTAMTFTGAHAALETTCTNCHSATSSALLWSGATSESSCSTCHASNFDATRTGHLTATGTNCSNCHTTTTFVGATLDHTNISTGCNQCHSNTHESGDYSAGECEWCHIVNKSWSYVHKQNTNDGCALCHYGKTEPKYRKTNL